MGRDCILEPEQEVPVSHEVEVVVIGGGTAGGVAAIAALTVNHATTPRRLPVPVLQATLRRWGTILFDSVFARIKAQYPDVELRETDIGRDERSGWLAPR